jgi:hypothetical protein
MIGFVTRERSAGVKKAGEKRERQRGWLGFLPFGIVSGRRERYVPCRLASSSREEAPARVGSAHGVRPQRRPGPGWMESAYPQLHHPSFPGVVAGVLSSTAVVTLLTLAFRYPYIARFPRALDTAGFARSTLKRHQPCLLHRHCRRQVPAVVCPATLRSTSQRLGHALCPSSHQARWLVPYSPCHGTASSFGRSWCLSLGEPTSLR